MQRSFRVRWLVGWKPFGLVFYTVGTEIPCESTTTIFTCLINVGVEDMRRKGDGSEIEAVSKMVSS